MRMLAMLRSLFLRATRRHRLEQSLDDEVRAYVDLLAAEHERAGVAPEVARRRALVETGGIAQVKEATRDAWVGEGIATFLRELRFTLRALRHAPGFFVTAVAILAIGIGGATAIFTVIKGSLLQPLPAVNDPAALVSLEPTKGDRLLYDFSYLDYLDLRQQSRSLSGLAGYDGTSMTLEDRWAPRRSTWVSYVTGNFFSVLGATPAAGRLLQAADEADASPVVVLAYDLWQARYGGNPDIIGSTVDLGGRPLTVVGVAQPRFIGAMLMHPMELWIPLTTLHTMISAPDMLYSRTETSIRLVGRLAPGSTIGRTQRELSLIATRLAQIYPADRGHGIKVFPGAGMTADERTELARLPRLLALAVGLLLLISCANAASLSLVRAGARRRELATRLALGASRSSLFGRLLLEGSVLATAGAVLGIGLAQLLVRSPAIMRTIAGMPTRVGLDVTLDRRVLAVALGVSAFTALVVSIAPVLHVMRVTPGAVLKDGAAGAVRRRSFGQRALVAAQIAASLVLLTSAAIVFSTFRRVLAIDPGFDARGLTAAGASLREVHFDSAQTIAYWRAWLRRAAQEPSITAAAVASVVPPAPWEQPRWIFRGGEEPSPGRRPDDAPAGGMRSYLDVVSPRFFDVMRIPIVIGRGFVESDDDRAAPVVVVSRRLAADVWPHENPIEKMLSLPPRGGHRRPEMRVIGVAGDVRFASIFDDAPPVAYMPMAQHPGSDLTFVLRSRSGAVLLDSAIRQIGSSIDPRVPMYTNVVAEKLDEQVQPQRVASAWIGVFGAIALLLAAIGLYGIVAQDVLQRTRELAVRSALGATPHGLLSLVIGDGMRIAAIGGALGALAGAAALRVLQSQFTGVSVVDVRASVMAAAVLCAAMMAASYLPARRAARLNPADALRCD
ncbi:MAG TPA: ADOP family duplicated permease [Gemmatimonadaceae bacterium]|nr:ADOP family duplicated permease [Gemmatimonadaceae bacterium]